MSVSLTQIVLTDEAATMLTEAFVNMGFPGNLQEASENFILNQFKSMIMSNMSTQIQSSHEQQMGTETQAAMATINAAFAD